MQTVLTQRREFWVLLTLAGIQFTHVLDFMIIMPLGPQLRDLFAINDAQFGFLVSAYTFAAGVSGLLAASFVDRFERKRLMLILYALFGLTTLACAFAPTYGLLMASRVASGIFGGILSAMTQTVIGDVIPFERRGRATGFVMTSFAMATVVGVPSGLFLASVGGWHSAFFVIAFLCLLVGVMAVVCLPTLNAHVLKAQGQHVSYAIRQVWADANHRKALYMSGAMMFAGFTIIPYITIYTQANHILAPDEIPYIYLCGGTVTLLSARWVGRLSDKLGKRKMFQRMLVLAMVPMTITTLLQPAPLPWVLLVFAGFFFCMNARMIPGMAMLTSAAQPQWRGTFLSLNSAVQSVSIGLASWLGGVLIQRDASGQVTHFWLCALVGIAATLLALAISRHVEMHSAPEPAVP